MSGPAATEGSFCGTIESIRARPTSPRQKRILPPQDTTSDPEPTGIRSIMVSRFMADGALDVMPAEGLDVSDPAIFGHSLQGPIF